MSQDGLTDTQLFFKLYAERERHLHMKYMESFYVKEDIYPIDEEAPLDLPKTTCIIVIEAIRIFLF